MSIFEQLKRWSSRVSALSLIVGAAGFAPVVAFAGPYLAMGFWLYEGETEPSVPEAGFPWLWVLPLLVGALASMGAELKTGNHRFQWLAILLAALAVLLEVTHLVELVVRARP